MNDIKKVRLKESVDIYKQDAEDKYNQIRIFINIFYLLAVFSVKDSIPALSFYIVFIVSVAAFLLSIWYWAVDSIKIRGYWQYISSYIDILLLLLMVSTFGGVNTWKTEAIYLGFVWSAVSVIKLDWKLTLSTISLWFGGLVTIFWFSVASGEVILGTVTQSHLTEVVSWGNVIILGFITVLYGYTITLITKMLYNAKIVELENLHLRDKD